MASRYMRCGLVVVFCAIAFYALSPSMVLGEVVRKDNGSVVCSFVGWLVMPLGFCAPEITTPDTEVPLVDVEKAHDQGTSYVNFSQFVSPVAEIAGASTSAVYANNYITISGQGVSQQELTSRLHNLILYVNLRDELTKTARVSEDTYEGDYKRNPEGLVTKEYLWKSLDRVNERISDLDGGGTTNNVTNNYATTTNATGDIYADTLTLGTTTNLSLLTVTGDIFLDNFIPSTTLNRLYNSGGTLYWSGVAITGSTTGSNWAETGSDVYRVSGNVGIGTSTPGSELTVVGEIAANSMTGEVYDMGGQVCNVEAYGAVGDNATINDAAIAAAIDDCGADGGTVFFPMGQFRISTPIVLDTPVTLRGSFAPRWSYASTPRSSIRADFNSFSGNAIIHVRDRTISGEVADNNGGRIENLSIDGGSTGTDINGIYFEGLVRDWKLTDVDISQTSGNGFEAAVGSGSGNPRGFTIRGLSIYSAGGHGFRATALNDTYIEDLLAVGNALRGIYLSSMGETKVNNSRSVFNALEGLYLDGSSNNGGITFTDFSTDRNDRHGVRISSTGTSTVVFNGLLTRRDGPNNGGGTETPYAGVAIIGSSTTPVAPVFINGLAQTIGLDDSSNPPLAPSVGVRVVNAVYVKIDGQLWGVDNAYIDGGGNTNFIIEDDSVLKLGSSSSTELYTNARKWVATTTGLFYGSGSVSIGSSTNGTRLFNIIASSNAGARFTDTTNNVMFDMRAEDSQAFFGTFSNHDIRFQTNNTSRLTIMNTGNVGIGTTTPSHLFTVSGNMNLTGALNSNGSPGSAGMVLQTTGVGTQWVATSSLGLGGATTFLALTDTPSSFTANRIPFTNSGATALTDSANFVFTGTNLGIGTSSPASTLDVWGNFRVGTSSTPTLFTNSALGRVGIGTVSPVTPLQISGGSDAQLSSGGYLVTGPTSGLNLAIDDDEIQARNNGSTATLNLQNGGGSVLIGGLTDVYWSDGSESGSHTLFKAYRSFGNAGGVALGYLANGTTDVAGMIRTVGNNVDLVILEDEGGEIIRFTDSRNVGIGTTSPAAKLDVWGNFRVGTSSTPVLFVDSASSRMGIGTSTPSAQLTTTGTVQFVALGSGGGTLITDAAGNVTVSSDERLKDILGNYSAGLNEVLLINPIRYHWNERSGFEMESEYAGFSAQNVQAALPLAVSENKQGFLTLADRSILAAVVNAIKELYAMVTGNREKIIELEERIEALESVQGVPVQTPTPQPNPEPIPEPEPVTESEPTPDREPEPELMPEPTPELETVPGVASDPESEVSIEAEPAG